MSSLLNQDQLYNRYERISYIYRWFISKGNLSESEQLMSTGEVFTEDQAKFIKQLINEVSYLQEEISKHIPNTWKWDRFNLIERSILINAAAEILLANNKKAIVIDESLEYSKIYCGEKATPLINGIIDKIGNQ